MSEYKMNQYDLQSYFKSLCNSFYIAYEQVKRLEKERKELRSQYSEEDLEVVNSIINLIEEKTTTNKYIIILYSNEELEEKKERLEKEKEEYIERIKELNKILEYWSDFMWDTHKVISDFIKSIIRYEEDNEEIDKDNKFSVIVTTKQEVYALIAFYSNNSVEEYPIINMEEKYRESFPTGEEVYEDFLKAYDFDYWADAKGVEEGAMKEVRKKYF